MIKIRPLIQVLGKIIKLPKGSYIDPESLGSGIPDNTKYLRGDGIWATAGGGGSVPDSRTITIDGVSQDLSVDRTWNVIPSGGTTGQILAKLDNTSYNLEWIENFANYTSTLKHEVKAGEVMTKGQAVYVSSADGTNIIVSKASNATEATSSKTMGLIAQTLAHNGKGFVITEGLLAGLNTSTATAGDPVWLGTGGNLIYGLINKPSAPAHLVFIGIVTRSNISNGEIFVRVQNGFELQELHNVAISSIVDDNLLQYDSATSLWKNESLSTAGIQPTLVSGTNIKTINGASVLGSGNLVVTGSGAAWGGITGTLSSQTDLQTALDGKVDENAAITGATKTKITFDAKGLVTSGSDATTADIAASTNKNYVTDAQLVVVGNTSGTNTGDQTSIVGITGTKAQFDTAVTDGNFVYVGDAVLNPEGWTTIVKTANQNVTNSATLVNDTDLQFAVVAGGHYMVIIDIVISCNSAAADYKSGFKVSAGTMKGSGIFTGTNNTAVAQNTAYNVNGTNATGIIASGTNAADLDLLASARIMFSFTASANATFSYQFAQNSAIAATTARTWKGSILKYKRLD